MRGNGEINSLVPWKEQRNGGVAGRRNKRHRESLVLPEPPLGKDGATPGVAMGMVEAGSGFTERCVTLLMLPGHLGLSSLTGQE